MVDRHRGVEMTGKTFADALRDAGFEDVKPKQLGSMAAIDFKIRSDAAGIEPRELHPSSLIINSEGVPDSFVLRFPAIDLAVHDRGEVREGLNAAATVAEQAGIPVRTFSEDSRTQANPHVDSMGDVPDDPDELARFLREMRSAFFTGVGVSDADFRDNIRRRMREGVSIEDVEDLGGLLLNIEAALDECLQPRTVPDFAKRGDRSPVLERLDEVASVKNIGVFGSFVRGTALRGESDLDLLVTLVITENPTFVRSTVEDCLLDRSAELIADHQSWFAGVDVVVVEEGLAREQVRRLFDVAFDDPRIPPSRVFDLREREFVSLA